MPYQIAMANWACMDASGRVPPVSGARLVGIERYALKIKKGEEMQPLGHKQIIAAHEWHRYGGMVPACVLGMVLVAMHAYALGVLLKPLEQEFGWSRFEISSGPLVTSIVTLVMAPFVGRILDRHGPRRMAMIGVPLFSLAFAMLSTAGPSIWSWLILYAVLGLALLMVFPTVWTAAIAVRFDRNRGLAMALALSGTGITSAVVPLATSELLQHFGWRGAYLGLALASFVIVFPVVALTFDREPRERSLDRPVSAKSLDRPPHHNEFVSFTYLKLAIAALLYSVGATGLAVNAVPILMTEGFTVIEAAQLAGMIGLGTIAGRLTGGILLDRIDGRIVAMACGFAAIGSTSLILYSDHSAWAAALACFLLGLAAGSEYDACAYLTTRYFPRRHFGALFGLIGGLAGLGAACAPMLASALYDRSETYDLVLWSILPLFTVASLLFVSLGRYPDDVDSS